MSEAEALETNDNKPVTELAPNSENGVKPKLKVMLIVPPFTQTKKAMKRCVFPLGIGYLAAVLEQKGVDVKALDCIAEGYGTEIDAGNGEITFGLAEAEIEQEIKEFNPDFVGVSCLMSRQSHNAHKVCAIAKKINPKVIHVSALPHQIIKDENVDYALIGDAEETIMDVLEGNTGKVVMCKPVDISKFPWPARHLFPMEKYISINMPTSVYSPHARITQIETTRGCPFRCVFCATTQFKGHYKMRPIDDVLAEIRFLKEKYKIQELDVIDSNFIVNRKRTMELLEGIEKIGLSWANPGGIWVGGLDPELLDKIKSSGCYQLSLAIESSTPRILNDVIDKPTKIEMVKPVVEHCHRIGIDLHAFFVVGFPEQTLEEIKNDYKFAQEMKFTSVSFNIISPLPGSRLYARHVGDVDFNDIDLRKASIPHPEISREELEKLVHHFNKSFNSSLIYRNPKMFFQKYVYTLLRKPSAKFMMRMFNRQ